MSQGAGCRVYSVGCRVQDSAGEGLVVGLFVTEEALIGILEASRGEDVFGAQHLGPQGPAHLNCGV